MAYRTTESDIKEIMDTSLTDEQVTPFLRAANALVNAVLTGEGYSDDLLKQIETWLAAHFVANRDPQVSREKIGDLDVQYDGKTDIGLKQTRYGQQAMLLDHHRKLAKIDSSKGPAEVKTIT